MLTICTCVHILNVLQREWDCRKADSNLKKHGIDLADAATVFFDELAITI